MHQDALQRRPGSASAQRSAVYATYHEEHHEANSSYRRPLYEGQLSPDTCVARLLPYMHDMILAMAHHWLKIWAVALRGDRGGTSKILLS